MKRLGQRWRGKARKMDFMYVCISHPRMCLLILERKKRREKHIKCRWVASHTCPNRGSNLQPWYVPLLGTKPAAFWCTRHLCNQMSHPAKAGEWIF